MRALGSEYLRSCLLRRINNFYDEFKSVKILYEDYISYSLNSTLCWKLLMNFLHVGEKINCYASPTLVYSLLNADVALSCPIQLYRTGLSEPGGGGRSANPISIRRADYAHHITPRIFRLSYGPGKYVLYVM